MACLHKVSTIGRLFLLDNGGADDSVLHKVGFRLRRESGAGLSTQCKCAIIIHRYLPALTPHYVRSAKMCSSTTKHQQQGFFFVFYHWVPGGFVIITIKKTQNIYNLHKFNNEVIRFMLPPGLVSSICPLKSKRSAFPYIVFVIFELILQNC